MSALLQSCRWLVAQLCPTLCDPMECSPPGSSVHGIFQARVLERVAISSFRESSQPRYQTQVFCLAVRFFTTEGNHSWTFIGRTDAEAEAPILWPPNAKNRLIGKDPDAGKDQRQEETTEDEMVGWRHWLDGHEFEQALGADDGQGSLACCGPWVTKSQTQLNNWTELNLKWLPFQILGKRNNLEFK